MKTIYVRVKPKSPVAVFHRCAIKFEQAWLEVTVDDATAKRLGEEQMLEVSETKPDGFEPTASDVSSLQLAAPDAPDVSDAVDQADVVATLRAECKRLLEDNHLLTATLKELKAAAPVDEVIAKGDKALEKLTAAVEKIADPAPADEAKPTKKAGK